MKLCNTVLHKLTNFSEQEGTPNFDVKKLILYIREIGTVELQGNTYSAKISSDMKSIELVDKKGKLQELLISKIKDYSKTPKEVILKV